MILTARNVVHYLLERGLLDAEAVVDGGLTIGESSRRNRNFKVLLRDRPGLFVKQVGTWDAQAIATVQREAACSWLAAHEPAYAALSPLIPAWRAFDPQRHVLVTELVDGETLAQLHHGTPGFPAGVAAALGRLLGTYHREVRTAPDDSVYNRIFQRAVPWILTAHRLAGQSFGERGAGAQVFEVVGREEGFPGGLEALERNWRVDGLIHGDVKWDNVLRAAGSGDGDAGDVELRLVDWELADLGDVLWDAGAVFAAYLFHWVASMPPEPGLTPAERVRRAASPLAAMQPAIAAYWRGYAGARALPPEAAGAALLRCVQYAAARLIQTAFEQAVHVRALAPSTLYLLQLSLNMLLRPREAAGELLGLTVPAAAGEGVADGGGEPG
jgi:Ser/Thr protein kinase RdoA (MazF antagonist)